MARTETYDQRAAILARLGARNRVVGLMRLLVPAAGAVIFLALVGQIYVSGLLREYGVSGLRIERGTIVVETPRYSGTGENGARYTVTATEASTPFDRPEEIALHDATLEYVPATGTALFVAAAAADMNTATQTVTIPGLASVTGADGMEAALENVRVDIAADFTTADGPVQITLADGTLITAQSLVRDGTAQLWTFTHATVILDGLPGVEPEAAAP